MEINDEERSCADFILIFQIVHVFFLKFINLYTPPNDECEFLSYGLAERRSHVLSVAAAVEQHEKGTGRADRAVCR